MTNERVYAMSFSKIYALLLAKACKKGRTEDDVQQAVTWLTGYSGDQIDSLAAGGTTYGDFFRNAPDMNPKRADIHGSVCGVKLEEISEPLMRDIRVLDKLIDDLAKGKPINKILPKD